MNAEITRETAHTDGGQSAETEIPTSQFQWFPGHSFPHRARTARTGRSRS